MSRRNSAARPRPKLPVEESVLRIIGGEWRSRKIPFPAIEGLRPTPDRVRETLFNWLQAYTAGSNCLDLFCGSGALGLEALSRGAQHVTFVDQAPEVVNQLKSNLQLLKAQNAEVIAASAMSWLEQRVTDEEARYDLVFLDPPFRKQLIEKVAILLESRNLLRDGSLIYLETEAEWVPQGILQHWELLREKTAGQVVSRLYRYNPPQLPETPSP
ncbi:16S rRNA (guanine(966)-N(2))-methyltransferase RsmD [Nitrincola sp. MINF-07-Sa-05]|uniref:16S rRNA (guanine(966)-N(2))-methyltransferase RsmD n=1 Tax=Nitrincola salilacus TaxID=3400273 RepID=UPI003917E088